MKEDKILEFAAAVDAKIAAQRKEKEAQRREMAAQYPYSVSNGMICRIKISGQEYQETPLCNFSAKIAEEVVRDDGINRAMLFVIEGATADGRSLPRIEVPADKFASMNWVTAEWGARAVVFAGNGVKDHLRTAIQLLSLQTGDIPRRTIYGHIGWRQIDGQWVYLHAGGAINDKGATDSIEVDAGQHLAGFILLQPPEKEELREAIRASLKILNLTKPETAYTLLSAIYRAPLGEVLPIDFSVFIAGPTGSQKSELTAIAQAHWGPGFTGKNLPANWASTGNSLEKLAFLAKDAILVIDDFAPHGSTADVQKLHKEADRILRAQGNIAGRLRMNVDGSLKASYFPRGLILSSGEDIPTGQSLAARMVITEVSRGDVKLNVLSELQQYAADGTLAKAMAGYIKWLAPQIEDLKKTLLQKKNEFRDEIRKNEKHIAHDRIPDNIASLAIGLYTFLRFAVSQGAITQSEARNYFETGLKALLKTGQAQGTYQQNEDPTDRFISLLSAAIATGAAYVANAKNNDMPEDNPTMWGWERENGGTYRPKGTLIGWIDGNDLLLEPETAYAVAQDMARKQSTSLPIRQRTLWKRMQQKDLLQSYEDGRLTVRRYIGRTRRRVIHISKDLIMDLGNEIENKNVAGQNDLDNAPSQANTGRPQQAPKQTSTARTGHKDIITPPGAQYSPPSGDGTTYVDDEMAF